MLGLPSTLFIPRSMESIEIDQKLQEIMKQTGYLTIGGQRYQAEINDLENLGEMGSGTCGQVWKMRFRKTGHVIAVKQMRRSGNKEENKRILMDLDVVLKSHDCPYIVQCFGTFITNTDVFIAMELMGTCAEKLKKRMQGPIPERILGKMTVAIVKALYYLKEKHGVIHRDVKPSNILLDERGQIKLCDFGISGRLVDSKAKTRSAGCAAYMAPERIDPPDPTKPDYDIRADVWSLGISLVELATGQFPYKNCKTDFEVLTKVLQEEPPLLPSHMGFSGDFQSFVKDCLTKDHRKRPKYNKLLEHSFIKRYETLEVDVASWFKDVMAKTESPRTSGVIRDFLQQLKNRVAREAIQKVHPGGLKGQRRRETQPPAPIEVWMDLAKKITGPLEEALTVAFSQALTIMAVEPVSLLYSKPSKPTQAHGKLLPLNIPSRQENPSPEAAGPTPEAAAGPSAEGDLEVDFEKIYKYLSSISHSCHGPELSPAESAVVLDLLMSLPEELSHLPCAALVEHMMDTYLHLMTPQSDPSGGNLGPGAEVCGTGSRGQEESSQATPQAPENARPSKPRSAWQVVGVCPLNPFLVPLELLGQVATPAK
ncbi:Dual specificity mitogen-activated protein kinase kinase 7 [Myotis brandtii]|uniref:Dual specificity mitogen-activated protein kinase kinase 7 n=1 Tax=Myotis brandtii TaxID=109478 RepID=S7N195_MYOBR|nr:Dual specificity mitogen-activated protein kinase kinase 7 [Myotis brandtii]